MQKRIAVLVFADASVKNSAQHVFGYDVDVGKSISEFLARELRKSGSYSVMDPKTIDKLQAEHAFSKANLADRNLAVKLGKILGVDGVVVGMSRSLAMWALARISTNSQDVELP